ncbi:SH3-like domain-containing protein, partial [Desemzia sp. RIT804]
ELGWIDKRGLDIETVTATKNIQYAAKISRSTDGINTKPFGVEGFETKMLSSEILGKEVRIIKEATTRRATWALIT